MRCLISFNFVFRPVCDIVEYLFSEEQYCSSNQTKLSDEIERIWPMIGIAIVPSHSPPNHT